MGYIKITTYAILFVFLLRIHEISSQSGYTEKPSEVSRTESNPLATLIADKNVIENVNNSNKLADEVLSRVKRQYRRYPPIIVGGGFGIGPGIGGYGGGFGGRGFGGRGFGGRGIGGRGIGGRAGGFGGGRGGRG